MNNYKQALSSVFLFYKKESCLKEEKKNK